MDKYYALKSAIEELSYQILKLRNVIERIDNGPIATVCGESVAENGLEYLLRKHMGKDKTEAKDD